MKIAFVITVALCLSGVLVGCRTARTPAEGQHGGDIANGLRMSLSVSGTGNGANPAVEIAIRNAGEDDVCLNLGSMLANGKVMIPDRIHLRVLNGGATPVDLQFIDRRFAGIAGRSDDYVIPLRSGSTYTLECRFDQFVSTATGDTLNLKPGRHQVFAWFQGTGATAGNADMTGVQLLNFWKDDLRSNPVVMGE